MSTAAWLLMSVIVSGLASVSEPDIVIAPALATPRTAGRDGGGPTPQPLPIGRVDTIGGTVFDWQMNGPERPMLISSPGFGLHALWVYSNNPMGYPDRNMRYNFYDYNLHQWMYNDPDYMYSGVGVFAQRSGCGNLAVEPVSGVAVVSAHQGQYHPVVARDIAPGAGFFEYCDGRPALDGLVWPAVGVAASGRIHLGLIDFPGDDRLLYSRNGTWCNWDAPTLIAPPQPEPGFPSHNIATSRVSGNVCITWVFEDPDGPVSPGYYRESTDDGNTWGAATEITTPQPFGGDTVPSFHNSSLYPWYDSYGYLHYVASVIPVVRDTAYFAPAVIFHWCASNGWTEIHRADADSILGSVGDNAAFAGRPTIAQDLDHPDRLFVAWEQFDGTNVEPATGLLRSDIWESYSVDGGNTWNLALRVTDRSTVSCRFPSIGDPIVDNNWYVLYLQDEVAGFAVLGQGPLTYNPVVVHKLWWVGAEEPQSTGGAPVDVRATPSPAAGRTAVRYSVPRAGSADLGVFDVAGRRVRVLAEGRVEAGHHTVEWDARSVPRGVYFLKFATGDRTVTRKLSVVH
jgi:hypothetical protein